jgi:peptidoglycan/xylan/chitin deacetylase (PgdA/CDA1 family)
MSCNIYDLFGSPHYWDRFFVSPDPWGYSSAYETTKRANTLSVIPRGECKSALELACAEGHFSALLADCIGSLVASDISAVALERAAVRCHGKANITFQKLDFVRDPIPGQFDLIVCSEVLYYLGTIERLRAVMWKLVEALAPDGLLVMTHANLVSDDPDQTGFDWPGHTFGAKTIGDIASHLGGLVLEQELRTSLYRVQRFRHVSSDIAKKAPVVLELALPMQLDRKLERGIIWDGAIRTREAALNGEETTTLPILCYHRIAENGPEALAPYRIDPRAFEQQVRWLRRRGYYSVSIAQWAEAMQQKAGLPGRPVLFTFDDGYRDFAEVAWPILDRHGFSALVFIVTGKVGTSAEWDADLGEPAPLMGWEEIGRLACEGVDFGSHSVDHRRLDSLPTDEVIEECSRSRAILEEKLKRPILAISYPWGVHNKDVRRSAADCGYTIGVTTRPARAQLTDDGLALPRVEVLGDCSLRNFADLFLYEDHDIPDQDGLRSAILASASAAWGRKPAIYNPGQLVDFRSGGNSGAYVSLGWSQQEHWGTWTEGSEAEICFLLEEPFKAGAKLCALVHPFVSPVHPVVRVEVECNGQFVAVWVLDRLEAAERSAIVPPGMIDDERVVRFCFRIFHPASPYGLGQSSDRRLLGLGFAELRLHRM